jgi:hypothetical protein
VACAKLYDRKTPITAADLLNDPRSCSTGNAQKPAHATRSKAGFREHITALLMSLKDYPIIVVPIPGGHGVSKAAEYNATLKQFGPLAQPLAWRLDRAVVRCCVADGATSGTGCWH